MGLPIHHLPVLQNWDCHVCGTCCKEYLVGLTEEEKRRIEAQGWDPEQDLGGHEPFVRRGPIWRRRLVLNHLIHHRAHLCVYLRLNDIPVPGMYGPSGDE